MTGNNMIKMESLDSTQTYLSEMLLKKALPEGTMVHALKQTSGRGLAEARWESSKGEGLTFSFVWYPSFLRADQQFLMNKAISLALHDFFISKVDREQIFIKWPNDIYINDKKAAGVLIENSIINNCFQHSVIGIGINLNQENFPEHLSNATSLKIATGRMFDLHACLGEICSMLDARYDQLKSKKHSNGREYLDKLYRFGKMSEYRYKGSPVRAAITGVSEFGQLIIKDGKGNTITCDLKEIEFLQS